MVKGDPTTIVLGGLNQKGNGCNGSKAGGIPMPQGAVAGYNTL